MATTKTIKSGISGAFSKPKTKMKELTAAFTPPKNTRLSDYFNGKSNVSGAFASKQTTMPALGLPGKMSMMPTASTAPAPVVPPPVAPGASTLFAGPSVSRGTSAPAPAPAAPVSAPTAPTPEAAEIPQQWLNPDGSFKSPEQIAEDIGSTMKGNQGEGDIGTLAGNQFGGGEKTAEQLRAEAMQIANTRNDIAVGDNDPYKVASKSGIAYTAAELSAIEKAYAGIYDPAITTALAKVEQKQIEDAAAKEAEVQKERDELLFKNELQSLAVSHDYDMEKLAKSHDYDVMLQGMKDAADAAGNGTGTMTPYSDERSQRSIQSVDELLPQIDENPGIFGRSAATPIPDFLRSDAYRNFRTELDTLKASVAFNELTAMREASKTGGALGNVSNIELGLLESALAGLRMDQSPDNLKEQLGKVKSSVNRWRTAQGAAPVGVSSGGGESIPAGTDGASYGYPGYVSDGKQWVLNE